MSTSTVESAQDAQIYVVFIPTEKGKMKLFGVSEGLTIEDIEAEIAQQTNTEPGQVAYYVGELGQTKQETANAAKNAGLRYISPENISKIGAFLQKYSDDASMTEIFAQHARISSRKGSPEQGTWAEPTLAELNALEAGEEPLVYASLS
ncbi:MAG: hypothetical protein GW778_05300 [Alphaproteobacteria bacterium]|nr:hypothetical protein [Alphaproteobacteria bacterium]